MPSRGKAAAAASGAAKDRRTCNGKIGADGSGKSSGNGNGDGTGGGTPKVTIEIKRKDGKIWSHVRSMWLVETPEERVRQEYLKVLVEEYGFTVTQMDEELIVTGRGSAQARADFVIWRTEQDKLDQKTPLIIVEAKSDNVTIRTNDYGQGENYARISGAPFFVTHNAVRNRQDVP